MSEEALQMAVKRRKVKGKGERERYTQLNAEFQRIGRRNKNSHGFGCLSINVFNYKVLP